jgi:hypothetical protein
MQSNDLQHEITLLQIQVLDHENRLDQAFSQNIEFRETKKIFQELKLLKEKLGELSQINKSNGTTS